MLMGMVSKVSRQALHNRLAEDNIDLRGLQIIVLHSLDHEDKQTISDLSKKFMLDPSTLVPVVDSLQDKGLVERRRDPDDRRRVPLFLTAAGREVIRKIEFVDDKDPIYIALQQMTPDDTRRLIDLVRNLVAHLDGGDDLLTSVNSRLDTHIHREQTLCKQQQIDE